MRRRHVIWGAFAYLLKPIEDEKLQATMTDVGKICEDQIRNEEKYDRWERLLKRTEMDFAGCRCKNMSRTGCRKKK